MTFDDFRKTHTQALNDYMVQLIQPVSNKVEEAMVYSIESGGKRIRPLMVLAVVEAFGQDPVQAYDVATAIEWIHTYSLIHDDLPAIDDDDLRRGRPSNHKVYGEATAILAGDGLLTHAFEVLARSKSLTDEQKVTLISELSSFAGTRGMIGGQYMDIQAENQAVPLDLLETIHRGKTGALIRYCFLAGAVCAHLDQERISYLDAIAQHLGLAFQIRDDILDVVGDVESLGKQPGQDEKLDKSTYPSLLGLEESYQALDRELAQAKDQLDQLKASQDQANESFDPTLLSDFIHRLRLDPSHG